MPYFCHNRLGRLKLQRRRNGAKRASLGGLNILRPTLKGLKHDQILAMLMLCDQDSERPQD